jgi:long-subunit fatty acid transport protein
VQAGDDTGVGFNVGFQAQVSPNFRVGGVYKKAPDFEFTQVDTIPFTPILTRTGDFQVPDTLGLGVAWRPSDALLIAADYVRVGHEALKHDFIDFQAISTGLEDQLEINDTNEFHLGVEWTLTQLSVPPALRAGVWFDPQHATRYVSDGTNSETDTRFQFILPGGEDLWHYTFGIGLPVSRRFEFNAGADITKSSSYVSASIIVRFF